LSRFLFLVFCFSFGSAFSQTWHPVGNCYSPATGIPIALEVWNNKLFVSGGANPGCVGPQAANLISFDGFYFDSLKGQVPGGAFDMVEYNGKLYVAGPFTWVDQNPWPNQTTTNRLAAWDGTNWSSAGIWGINGEIKALAVYNNELYAGGYFTQINGIPKYAIARWDGNQWRDVGGGLFGGYVTCMEVFNGELYVGGQVGLPGGQPYYYNCVRWNGSQWDSVGGRWVPNWVTSMCVDTINNLLFIGGGLSFVDTISFWQVARWNGNIVTSIGHCPTAGATHMCFFQNDLFVGGTGFSDTVLAKYTGSSWLPVEINPNSGISTLGIYQGNLYVGGGFSQINNVQANGFACYGFTCPQGVGINESGSYPGLFKIFPNPAKNEVTIEFNDKANQNKFKLWLFDATGRQREELTFKNKTSLNLLHLPSGIYQIRVCDTQGKTCHSEKLIVE
jgi:hypothetical protein